MNSTQWRRSFEYPPTGMTWGEPKLVLTLQEVEDHSGSISHAPADGNAALTCVDTINEPRVT